MLNPLDALIWPDNFEGHVKAFFTRRSVGVDRAKIGRLLSIDQDDICMPLQKHTDIVWVLRRGQTPITADAIVTQERGLLIGVQVADCVPVLLHDRRKSVVGSIHAGWKGTALQIVKKTVFFMEEQFGSEPNDVTVAFGPSIRGGCYFVDADVRDAVIRATGPGNYVVPKDGKFCLDLTSAITLQAISAGIPQRNLWTSPECTYCNPREFHSFRYHKNYAGRQGGFIGIF